MKKIRIEESADKISFVKYSQHKPQKISYYIMIRNSLNQHPRHIIVEEYSRNNQQDKHQ